jgi:hypothetical protein
VLRPTLKFFDCQIKGSTLFLIELDNMICVSAIQPECTTSKAEHENEERLLDVQ